MLGRHSFSGGESRSSCLPRPSCTRREIITKCGAGLAAILAAGKAPAAFVRSLIAARNAMMAGGWKNPYITDGLVAMWDGEWNAGGGIHDATLLTPKNLVDGGGELTRYGTPTEVGDNYYAVRSNCYWHTNVNIVGDFTIEGGCEGIQGVTNYSHMVYSNRLSGWTGRMTQLGGSSTGVYSFMNPSKSIGSAVSYESALWFSYKASAGACDLYIDGQRKGSATATGAFVTSDFAQPFILCGALGSHAYSWNGRMYTIRLYSRALTAAEVAANYAVDKARFNLPDAN